MAPTAAQCIHNCRDPLAASLLHKVALQFVYHQTVASLPGSAGSSLHSPVPVVSSREIVRTPADMRLMDTSCCVEDGRQ